MRVVARLVAVASLLSAPPVLADDAADPVSTTVVGVKKGDDEVTVTIAVKWAKGAARPKSDEITLAFLFQDNLDPALKLDEATLANMGSGNAIVQLKSENVVVVRDTADRKARLSGTVVQVVSGDGTDKAMDWRKDGEYTFTLPTRRPAAFELPMKSIHVGMFQETDPKKWQQSSTSYKALGKAVKLPAK